MQVQEGKEMYSIVYRHSLTGRRVQKAVQVKNKGERTNMEKVKAPLYQGIKQDLLDKIYAGLLKSDAQIPSEKELSEQFKVSRITVRRALEELEEEGFIYRRQGKGTFVSLHIPAMEGAKGKKRTETGKRVIGVIMSHLDSPFQVSLLQSIEKALGKRDCQMMFGLSNGKTKIESELIDRMQLHGVHGLIIYPVDGAFYSEKILRLTMDGFPVVLVDRYLPGINTSCVYSDDRRGGQLLGEYLVSRGHREIALFSQDPKETICLMNRIDGFTNAVLAAGILQKEENIINYMVNCSTSSNPEQYRKNVEIIADFLVVRSEITAVFCTIATFAMNTLWALKQLETGGYGERKLEIVCFDNIEPYQWTEKYPVTYIAHSEVEMGNRAVELVFQLINGKSVENVMIPCELMIHGQ